MLALTPNQMLCLADDIMLRAVPENDLYYAFNLRDGVHFRLNETAFWILETIGQGIRYGDLLKSFLEKYAIEANEAEKDLIDVVESFEAFRVLNAPSTEGGDHEVKKV